MIELKPDQSSATIRALFAGVDLPAGLRCQGVLEGCFPGVIYTDSPEFSSWAVVRETVYGTLYPTGAGIGESLEILINDLNATQEVLIGLWDDDPLVTRIQAFSTRPQYEGRVIDFTRRSQTHDLTHLTRNVPEGCHLLPMTADLHRQSPWYDDRLKTWGTVEAILAQEIGFGLVRAADGRLLSEASAGKIATGIMEVGTITQPEQRGKGYATAVSAATIQRCEALGFQTYWNCNAANLASVALGRKMGYQTVREYRLFGWFPAA